MSNTKNTWEAGGPLYIIYYTLNIIGSLKRTFQYYYHATPGEPYKGSPGVAR